MPFVWNREVDTYKVDIFASNTLAYSRSIRLSLKPSGSAPAHTVSIEFHSAPPAAFVTIGSTFSTIMMGLDRFDSVYHLLQTEKPVYFTAYESGSPPIRFAGLTTDPEGTGEGFRDANLP
jgi:hypothetical protein